MPLLISKQQLYDEVIKIKGPEHFDMAISSNDESTTIDLMLKWTQAICATYDHAVEDFKLSFADGKSFLYLIDFYLPGYLPSHILKEPYVIETLELTMKDSSDPKALTHKYTIVEDAMKQLYKIPEVLQITDFLEGDPPCNERCVIILLTFLASQLLEGKSLNQAFSLKRNTAAGNSEKIVPQRYCKQTECRDGEHLAAIKIQSFYRSVLQRRCYLIALEGRNYIDKELDFMVAHEKLAIQIQSRWRSFSERKQFLKFKASVTTIQRAIRSWLHVKRENKIIVHSIRCSTIQGSIEEVAATTVQSHFKGFLERKQLLMMKSAALHIQRVIRAWLVTRRIVREEEAATTVQSHYKCFVQRKQFLMMKSAALYSQRLIRALLVARCMVRQERASIVIQSNYRGLIERRCFLKSKAAVLLLQTAVRVCVTAAQKRKCAQKVERAAIIIQRHIRGWIQRSRYILLVNYIRKIQSMYRAYKHKQELIKAALKIQCTWKRFIIQSKFSRLRFAATKIQSYWKGWLARNYYKEQKASAIVIQRCFRGYMCRERYKLFIEALIKVQSVIRGKMAVRTYLKYKTAILKLQCAFRNWLVRKDVQKASEAAITIQQFYCGHAARLLYYSQKREHMTNAEDIIVGQDLDCFEHDVCISNSCKARAKEIVRRHVQGVKQRRQFHKIRDSVLKLQGWWRKVLARRSWSAVVIQSHIRGWFCRKNLSSLKSAVLSIQAYWRSYLVWKNQVAIKQELLNLRLRIQHSAANVDDSLRLENRLTKALEALLSHKTLSGILHTCATLDTATHHSKRCCERLVAAGAIDKLLQLISSTNRSAPHEEVLKHALSVLCNIAHYPELAQLVVDTRSSINTIAEQLLRNREEAFCKAAEILRKLCAVKGGVDAIRTLTPIIRRLQYLRQNLEKKVETEQRSLAKLPPKVPAATRKAGERRLREADSQCQLIVHILECVTGESSRRRSDVPKTRPQSDLLPKMESTGSTDHTRRVSKGRNPFQDCSNH